MTGSKPDGARSPLPLAVLAIAIFAVLCLHPGPSPWWPPPSEFRQAIDKGTTELGGWPVFVQWSVAVVPWPGDPAIGHYLAMPSSDTSYEPGPLTQAMLEQSAIDLTGRPASPAARHAAFQLAWAFTNRGPRWGASLAAWARAAPLDQPVARAEFAAHALLFERGHDRRVVCRELLEARIRANFRDPVSAYEVLGRYDGRAQRSDANASPCRPGCTAWRRGWPAGSFHGYRFDGRSSKRMLELLVEWLRHVERDAGSAWAVLPALASPAGVEALAVIAIGLAPPALLGALFVLVCWLAFAALARPRALSLAFRADCPLDRRRARSVACSAQLVGVLSFGVFGGALSLAFTASESIRLLRLPELFDVLLSAAPHSPSFPGPRPLAVALVVWLSAAVCTRLAGRSSGEQAVDGLTPWFPLVAMGVFGFPLAYHQSWIAPQVLAFGAVAAVLAWLLEDPLYARERRLCGRLALAVLGILTAQACGHLLRPLVKANLALHVTRLAFELGLVPFVAGWILAHQPAGERPWLFRALACGTGPALVAACAATAYLAGNRAFSAALLEALLTGIPALAVAVLAATVGARLAPPDAGDVPDSPGFLVRTLGGPTDEWAPFAACVTLGAASAAVMALMVR